MKILALEFSSEERSVAIATYEEGNTRILGAARETGGRSTRAFVLIEKALAKAGLNRTAIEGIAVGIGPGSYTGIRAAISVAQGWQLATGLKCFGVSSVSAVAHLAQATGTFGRVAIVVDAQRGDFYVASYNISSLDLQETVPLKIVPAREVMECAHRGELIIGPDSKAFPNGAVLVPRAEEIARLGFTSAPIPAEMLEPIYLRETTFVKAPPGRIVP